MKNTIKKYKNRIEQIYGAYVKSLLLRSDFSVECPCCGWQGNHFFAQPIVDGERLDALCPKCGSLERHRLYYIYLKNIIPTEKKVKVLHFAPEDVLAKLFNSFDNVDYVSADINPKKAMVKEDIMQLSFKKDSFDIIFCAHVLEHIVDDVGAMSELKRVLRSGGIAILQVPIKKEFKGIAINKTYEDSSVIDPAERAKKFGQSDHVRIYGVDYVDRLRTSGFKVNINKFANSLNEDLIDKYSLLPNDDMGGDFEGWIYECRK